MRPSIWKRGALAVVGVAACMSVRALFCLTAACTPPCVAQEQSSADRRLPWVTDAVDAPGVSYRTFDSRAAGGKVSYHVFTPADHDDSAVRLPVLYWLHGTGGGGAGIRPLAEHFGDAMRAGRIPPMLVVFVNGLPARLWADSKDGSSPVETVFIGELIPEVDRSLRTIAAREGRIIEGFSMGGYGAARLGFKHPDIFAGISILAGGPFDLDLQGPRARDPQMREALLRNVCGGDLGYFREISPLSIARTAAATLRERGTTIRHAVGDRDNTRDLNHGFHALMQDLGIPHEYVEVPNVGHDPRAVLTALAADDGAFYRRALGTAPPERLRKP